MGTRNTNNSIMGRLHSNGKGISGSALPYRRSVPTWLKLTSEYVKQQSYQLAKKGLTPSQIGVILRDSHGVAQTRAITGTRFSEFSKQKDSLLPFLKTFTVSSRRPFKSASTSRETAKTRTPSSVSS